MRPIKKLLGAILDLIFPTYCLSCEKSGEELCLKCLSETPAAERESAEWIFPLYDYRHPPVKKAIHLLKYKGKKNLALVFAGALHGRILEELADFSMMENFSAPLLIPIPLSKKRRRERGFNQAELICQKLVELDAGENFKLEKNILVRAKDNVHQAHIENRAERLRNIVGSFEVRNKEPIKKKNIILIDDVTTTSATLSEAKKVLEQAGARKVIAFTVAH